MYTSFRPVQYRVVWRVAGRCNAKMEMKRALLFGKQNRRKARQR
jgi:hypothetical protein